MSNKINTKQLNIESTQSQNVEALAVEFGGPTREFILKIQPGKAEDGMTHLEHVTNTLNTHNIPYSVLYRYFADTEGIKIQRSTENQCEAPTLEGLKSAFRECYMHFVPQTFPQLMARGKMQCYFAVTRIRRVDHAANRNDWITPRDLAIGVNTEDELVIKLFPVNRAIGVFPLQENYRTLGRQVQGSQQNSAGRTYEEMSQASESL